MLERLLGTATLGLPIISDGARGACESLHSPAVRDDLALGAGRAQLREASRDHDDSACSRHESVAAQPARCDFDFARPPKSIPRATTEKPEDNKALGQERDVMVCAKRMSERGDQITHKHRRSYDQSHVCEPFANTRLELVRVGRHLAKKPRAKRADKAGRRRSRQPATWSRCRY